VEKWGRFLRLTGFEREIIIEGVIGLLVTRVGLHLVGFRRWSVALSKIAPLRPESVKRESPILPSANVIARMESGAARSLFYRPSCLERSMVLCWLLRSRGIPAELRVGAHRQATRFEAHAWVECEGVVLNDSDDVHLHFVPFDGPVVPLERVSH
jgi:Transglutaminase-like superfamily